RLWERISRAANQSKDKTLCLNHNDSAPTIEQNNTQFSSTPLAHSGPSRSLNYHHAKRVQSERLGRISAVTP
ncbi:hypothetical protein CEXT_345781, partial [Caerostris extrusa]